MNEPTHRCVVCTRPMETSGFACRSCEARIDANLQAIPDLHAMLPTALERQGSAGPKVSGSREAPIPLRVDTVDLGLPARNAVVVDLHGDQIGELSTATILDQWVRDWRDTLWPGQHLPKPDVASLAQWLRNHLPDACDSHPAIDEFADEIKSLVRTLNRTLGQTRRSGEFVGLCPSVLREGTRCNTRLAADPYVDRIDCPRCSTTWPRRRWLQLAAMQQDAKEAS